MESFVRIFKSLLIGLLLTIIHGQSMDSISFSKLDAATIQDSLLHILKKKDYDGYEYRIKSFTPTDSQKVAYQLVGQKFHIQSLLFNDSLKIKQKILNQMFSGLLGLNLDYFELKMEMKDIQQSHNFLNNELTYLIGRDSENQVGLFIRTKPEFKHQMSAIIGVNQKNDRSTHLLGQIDFDIENMWKLAESIGVYWNKTDSLSQTLEMDVTWPYLFGTPIGLNMSLSRKIFKGQYTQSNSVYQIQSNRILRGILRIGYAKSHIHVSELGQALGLYPNKIKSITGEFERQTLNNRWLPTDGQSLHIQTKIGLLEENLYYHIFMRYKKLFPIRSKVYGEVSFWSEGAFANGTDLPRTRYVKYGGHNTLKGFNEDQFNAPWVMSPEISLNYRMNSSLEGEIFYQSAITQESLHQSISFGIRQVNSSSIINIIYGIPINEKNMKGILHFKYVSTF